MFDLDMFTDGLGLLLKGKLFLDTAFVLRQAILGILIGAFALICLSKLGVPMTYAVPAAALFAGMLQPLLFKDIKFR